MSEKRSDTSMFIEISYYLSFASTGILIITIILGFVAQDTFLAPLRHLVWLVLITSAIGTFLAFAVRSDFKKKDIEPDEEDAYKLRIALRVNIMALAFMLMMASCLLLIAINPNIG